MKRYAIIKQFIIMLILLMMVYSINAEMVSIHPVPIRVDINPDLDVNIVSTGMPSLGNLSDEGIIGNHDIIINKSSFNGSVINITPRIYKLNRTFNTTYSLNLTHNQSGYSFNATLIRANGTVPEVKYTFDVIKRDNPSDQLPIPVYKLNNAGQARSINPEEMPKDGEIRKVQSKTAPVPILSRLKSFLADLFS